MSASSNSTAGREKPGVPRVTLTIAEAAFALGISESSFRTLVLRSGGFATPARDSSSCASSEPRPLGRETRGGGRLLKRATDEGAFVAACVAAHAAQRSYPPRRATVARTDAPPYREQANRIARSRRVTEASTGSSTPLPTGDELAPIPSDTTMTTTGVDRSSRGDLNECRLGWRRLRVGKVCYHP